MWTSKDNWLNELWCGDNVEVLKNIPDESVDLIYIDPPFFSNRHYEIIWGNGAELRSFKDHWKGGIDHYVTWMVERLKQLHRILKPTGSLYIHLDWHAVHYLKVALDKIFVEPHSFREIIWSLQTVNGFKSTAKNWIRCHDTLLYYTKSKKFTFNKQYLPHKDEYIKRFKKVDKVGRKYRDDRSGGRIQYLDSTPGRLIGDVWDDVMSFQQASTSSELLGYPTQKPVALLERIIKASSNPGDVVLDAFCGCGTTIAACENLDRKWIAIDVSPVAVKVMTERIWELNKKKGKKTQDFITLGLPDDTLAQIDKIFSGTKGGQEFQQFMIKQIDAKPPARTVHDFGIDGFTKDEIPIQVKKSEKIGRNVVDNFNSAIRRVRSESGKIYAISFGKRAYEEAARLKNEDGIEIELIELRPFLVEKYGDHTHHE